ncbi:peroxisomal biogenesis factor 11 [Hypoxylon cercidicola]|nr:peroxisomal biogenesis factor 11 [Hypoxylon cercidicola]
MVSMSLWVEQLIKFTTDSVGLERTFRLIQATVQILSHFALPFDLLLSVLTLTCVSPPSALATRTVLAALNQRLGLARRYFRVFRFLESFHAAQKLYSRLSSSPSSSPGSRRPAWVQVEPWLDMSARTFNGLYLLLETTTTVDALAVPGLRVWTPQQERRVAVEAQRFWLFALACGVLYNLLEILNVLAYTPVPAAGSGFGVDQPQGGEKEQDEQLSEKEKSADDLKKEQQRLRAIVNARKEQRRLWRRQVRGKISKLGRGALANALDTVLPGSAIGWLKVEPGTVSIAMFVTTILTGMDVWERCGREVLAGK